MIEGGVEIYTLAPGTRFRTPADADGPGKRGKLILANDARARIIYDTRYTEVTGTDGKIARLPSYESPMDISPHTIVIPIVE